MQRKRCGMQAEKKVKKHDKGGAAAALMEEEDQAGAAAAHPELTPDQLDPPAKMLASCFTCNREESEWGL